jgi:MerR family transcriptional regulator, thiopeptide resistance regulator
VGFSLAQIKQMLSHRDFKAIDALRLQRQRVQQQIKEQQRLCARLETLVEAMESRKRISNDELIQIIQETTMQDKYFTPEQSEKIKQRATEVGQQRIEQSQQDWQTLMAKVQAEMDKGTAPTDPRVVEFARQWNSLVEEFTGGDPGIRNSLNNMYKNESVIHGMQIEPIRGMMKYISQAMQIAKQSQK